MSQDALVTQLNHVWVLIAVTLVFFMQAGFLLVESGLVRAKNSIKATPGDESTTIAAVEEPLGRRFHRHNLEKFAGTEMAEVKSAFCRAIASGNTKVLSV